MAAFKYRHNETALHAKVLFQGLCSQTLRAGRLLPASIGSGLETQIARFSITLTWHLWDIHIEFMNYWYMSTFTSITSYWLVKKILENQHLIKISSTYACQFWPGFELGTKLKSAKLQLHYEKQVISIVRSNAYCEIWQILAISSVYKHSTQGNKVKCIVPYIIDKYH